MFALCLIQAWLLITCEGKAAPSGPQSRKLLIETERQLLDGHCRLPEDGGSGTHHFLAEGARLQQVGEGEDAKACFVQALGSDPTLGVAWAQLGSAYHEAGDLSKAQGFFAEAKRLVGGACARHVHDWHFLGPFPIGKQEQDGDPVAALGGIHNVPVGSGTYYSEYGAGGRVGWTAFRADSAGAVAIQFPHIDWNDLVRSLEWKMAVLQFQG